MIKYIGSKRALLPRILRAIGAAAPPGARVADLFSGTSRVGQALKAAGYRVHANDHNAYAHVIATCHVQADAERWAEPARRILVFVATDSFPSTIQHGHVVELQALGAVCRKQHQSCLPAAHLPPPFRQPFDKMTCRQFSATGLEVVCCYRLSQQ